VGTASVSRHRSPSRLRLATYRTARPYFITFCVFRRVPALADPHVAGVLRSAILYYRNLGWYSLPAYCIMPDHVHLLVIPRTIERHVSCIVGSIKNRVRRDLAGSGKSITWQWGYFDRILRESEAISAVAHYVVMNPQRAGLVRDYRDWTFGGVVDFWN